MCENLRWKAPTFVGVLYIGRWIPSRAFGGFAMTAGVCSKDILVQTKEFWWIVLEYSCRIQSLIGLPVERF
jgi:hypothetical protein